MKEFLFVFAGGGVGSMMRYLCGKLMPAGTGVVATFPWATLAVNVIGCFCIGLFYVLSEKCNLSSDVRLLLTTGLCGGFTTFSTFSSESLQMLRSGQMLFFIIYIMLSILLGLLAVVFGGMLGTK